jgi:hypothetical protein
MPKNTITPIYKSHESHFLKNLRQARGLEENSLHKLRVDIKNLRVLIDLLRILSGKKFRGKAMSKQLEPVFKAAGRIRTAALNLKQSQTYRSPVLVKFRQHLRSKQEEASQEFLHVLRKFDGKKFRKLHKKALEEFRELKEGKIKKGAEEYMRVLFAHIRADIFDITDDETLHQIRKRLKSIKNIGQLLDQIDDGHPFKEELVKVHRTYDKIGQWHDTLELTETLEEYVDDLDDPEALEQTAPLILTLKKRCLLNKRQIEKRLKIDMVM